MRNALKAVAFATAFTAGIIALILGAIWLAFVAANRFGEFETFCGAMVIVIFLGGLGCYSGIKEEAER